MGNFLVIVKGSPKDEISIHRSLKQEDSMTPFLYFGGGGAHCHDE